MAAKMPPLHVQEMQTVDLANDSLSETCSSASSPSVRLNGNRDNDRKSADKLVSKMEGNTQESEMEELREHEEQHLTSDLKTFCNTCIAFLGSGVLGLPYAFSKCGILMGLVTLIGVAAVSTYAMMLVVACKYKLKQQGTHVTKYGEVGYFAMGKVGTVLVDTALVISQTGFCVAYLIFIASNANKFLDVSKELVVSVCVPPLVGFSLLKHMKELAYVALLADFMCFLGLVVVLKIDLDYMRLDHDNIKAVGVLSAMPFFFGVASYCFEGVGMVLPLENSMQNKGNFTPILVSTVVIITTLYATFGICGYLAFGDATEDVITLNFEGGSGLATLVKLCLCLGLFFTYPVMLFPVFEVLTLLLKCGNKDEDPQLTEKKSTVMRAGVVLLTAVVAAGIPDFGRFIAFIGSTCCSMLAFILPAFFYLRLHRDERPTLRNRLRQLVLLVLIALGFAMLIAGVAEAVQSIL